MFVSVDAFIYSCAAPYAFTEEGSLHNLHGKSSIALHGHTIQLSVARWIQGTITSMLLSYHLHRAFGILTPVIKITQFLLAFGGYITIDVDNKLTPYLSLAHN